MSLIGARPYTCKHCGTEFWVAGEDTCWCCPCCDSTDVDYEEGDTPIFALTVEDVRCIQTHPDDEQTDGAFAYQDFTIQQCIAAGQKMSTDLGQLDDRAYTILHPEGFVES